RDFAIEFLCHCSILMMHLSRLSEELILWSTEEFSFIELSDAYTTGSSIMPQKKNPDVAELIRGKTGRIYGSLISLLTTMKGLPLSYNRDMQEDKEPIFYTADSIKLSLKVLKDMLLSLSFKKKNMKDALEKGFLTATDLAEYLVKKGMPFRSAHEVIGKLVIYCINKNKQLHELGMDEFKSFSALFCKDVYEVLNAVESIKHKKSQGGTSTESVKAQVENLKNKLEKIKKDIK
ncbi:MAG: argininosuccinate lyase, partial [Thermodesulfovibrionales bacterium]|nr:argininosuccinate lyase [Thermodesulfovibrionales bacterium]